MHSRKRAFTLIELLVVISIIAILAGLALPALAGAQKAAKKAKANTMCQQLKIAVTAFNTEYGTWPGTGQTLDDGTLYQALNGTSQNNAYNTRNIVFMEFTSKDLDNPTAPTMFIDPWYISNNKQAGQNYQVMVDDDFDGQITGLPPGSNNGPATLSASVEVWDPGVPDKQGTVNSSNSAALIRTW